MDRLRRSIRQSFRRSKKTPSSSSSSAPGAGDSSAQPQQWHNDESAVRAGNCSFQVKYLGCTEVFESRGMHICEDALKQLRNSARKSQRAILHISGDGLRVVDATSSQLIVDQTIEKVSFCAPDRNHDRGFSYICRDGATRRWLCHGFVAVRESSPLQGERLSHAVGCAFQICLERKQKRDREVAAITTVGTVSEVASIHSAPVFQTPPRSSSSTPLNHPTTPSSSTSFVRQASSRQSATIVQRMQDPQEYKAASPPPPPTKTVVNPHMRDRPHVTPQMLQRQQSLHTFSTLNSVTPFKKNASLQTRDRPEAIGAARWRSLDVPSVQPAAAYTNGNVPTWEDGSPILDTDVLPEEPEELTNEVSRLCQQMSFDLSIMSANEPHLDNGHHFSPAAIASNGPTNVHSLPKSVSSPFPPPNQQKPYETAKEARARFSQRSAGSRVVHPPSVNGQQQPQQPSVAAHQRHNQTIDWSVEADPFNADWVNLNKNTLNSTNPFIV